MAHPISSGAKQLHAELSLSIREDLMDRIINKSPIDTPLFSMTPDGPAATSIKVEYLTDSTTGGFAANSYSDGEEYTFTTPGNRTRLSNYCQLFINTWKVGREIEACNQAGLKSEYAYQMQKAMDNHGLAFEYAVTYGTSASGASATASGTAATLAGYNAHILTYTATASANAAFSLSAVNEILQNIVSNTTGKPELLLVAPELKEQASDWTTPATKNINVEDKRYIRGVSIYDGDFGLLRFQWDRWLAAANTPNDDYNYCFILDMSTWQKSILQRTKAEEVPIAAYARAGALATAFTVLALAESCNGKILVSNA